VARWDNVAEKAQLAEPLRVDENELNGLSVTDSVGNAVLLPVQLHEMEAHGLLESDGDGVAELDWVDPTASVLLGVDNQLALAVPLGVASAVPVPLRLRVTDTVIRAVAARVCRWLSVHVLCM